MHAFYISEDRARKLFGLLEEKKVSDIADGKPAGMWGEDGWGDTSTSEDNSSVTNASRTMMLGWFPPESIYFSE